MRRKRWLAKKRMRGNKKELERNGKRGEGRNGIKQIRLPQPRRGCWQESEGMSVSSLEILEIADSYRKSPSLLSRYPYNYRRKLNVRRTF